MCRLDATCSVRVIISCCQLYTYTLYIILSKNNHNFDLRDNLIKFNKLNKFNNLSGIGKREKGGVELEGGWVDHL